MARDRVPGSVQFTYINQTFETMTAKQANRVINKYLNMNHRYLMLLETQSSTYDKATIYSILDRNNGIIDNLKFNYC